MHGQTVLKIDCGSAIQIELVQSGAASAMAVAISSGYQTIVQELLEEAKLPDRVDREVLNIARQPKAISRADVIIMQRKVWC